MLLPNYLLCPKSLQLELWRTDMQHSYLKVLSLGNQGKKCFGLRVCVNFFFFKLNGLINTGNKQADWLWNLHSLWAFYESKLQNSNKPPIRQRWPLVNIEKCLRSGENCNTESKCQVAKMWCVDYSFFLQERVTLLLHD